MVNKTELNYAARYALPFAAFVDIIPGNRFLVTDYFLLEDIC